MNRIIQALNDEHADWLRPHLKPVQLKARDQLQRPNQLAECVLFIETGIAAVFAVSGKTKIGVGLIGCEGATVIPLLLGAACCLHSTEMLSDGTALSISANALHDAMEQTPELRKLLLRYALAFHHQVAHTALSNAKGSVQQRVARWLLMIHDRVAKDDIPLTHELIANALGIRRAGVSVALAHLQRAGLIEMGHGHVQVLDRKGLRDFVGHFYGAPERELVRLIGR